MNKKIRKWLPILLFAGGFLLAYGGWKLSLSWIIYLGFLPIGAAVILFGIDAIQKKESSYTGGGEETSFTYSYRGVAAIMDGLVLVLLGLGIMVFGVIALFGQQDNTLNFLQHRPGAILIFSGLLMAAYSITLILGSQEAKRGWRLLGSLPQRIFGLVLLIFGLGLIFVGGWEIISPTGYDQLVDSVKNNYLGFPEY
jgi:hypothetical protein